MSCQTKCVPQGTFLGLVLFNIYVTGLKFWNPIWNSDSVRWYYSLEIDTSANELETKSFGELNQYIKIFSEKEKTTMPSQTVPSSGNLR